MLASWPHLHAINFILPGAINWTDLVLCDNWIFIALEASKLCFSCERSYVIATALHYVKVDQRKVICHFFTP